MYQHVHNKNTLTQTFTHLHTTSQNNTQRKTSNIQHLTQLYITFLFAKTRLLAHNLRQVCNILQNFTTITIHNSTQLYQHVDNYTNFAELYTALHKYTQLVIVLFYFTKIIIITKQCTIVQNPTRLYKALHIFTIFRQLGKKSFTQLLHFYKKTTLHIFAKKLNTTLHTNRNTFTKLHYNWQDCTKFTQLHTTLQICTQTLHNLTTLHNQQYATFINRAQNSTNFTFYTPLHNFLQFFTNTSHNCTNFLQILYTLYKTLHNYTKLDKTLHKPTTIYNTNTYTSVDTSTELYNIVYNFYNSLHNFTTFQHFITTHLQNCTTLYTTLHKSTNSTKP